MASWDYLFMSWLYVLCTFSIVFKEMYEKRDVEIKLFLFVFRQIKCYFLDNKQNSCMEEKDSLFPAFRSLLCEGKKDLGCPIYPPPPHSWESWHSKKMARVLRNRSRWGLDLQEGKRKISHLSSKELKLSFCDYRVTSKESQENASQEFLTLNPKVTFKILTHPICITQERHLHRTYLWRSFAQLLHHTCSPTWAGLKMIPNLLLYFLPLQVRENLH